jgi:Uma2 family endonuclease
MADPARREAGWDDLLEVPEECIGEIVDGELVVHPQPALPHVESASDLGGLLQAPFRFGNGGPGGWIILDEPRIAFGRDIRVPDLAGWRRERYERTERGPLRAIPDWVCEVLSPGTAVSDRTKKLPLYARHGVPFLWLLDPVAFSLEVFKLGPDGWIVTLLAEGRERVRAVPFDAVELDLSLVWGDRIDAPSPPRE